MKNIDRKTIGCEIRKARKSKKLSQFELAELCGIDEKQIYRIETGISSPKLENFLKIANILSLDIKYFNMFDINANPYVREIFDILNEADDFKIKIYYNVLKSLEKNL